MARPDTLDPTPPPAGGPGADAPRRGGRGDFPLQHLSIHGHHIGYRRAGDGPVLLLLHGIAGSSRTWLPAMTRLADEYTVVAPDFFGHGESAKPPGDYSLGSHASTMRDFLHVLGLDEATVIGQSYGGGVAMQFAYQFPERCQRLVLVDAGGLGREVNLILRLVTVPGAGYVLPLLFPGVIRAVGDPVARFLGRLGIGNTETAEIWRAYRSLTDADSMRAFVATMRSVIEPRGQSVSAIDRLYLAAHVPTLIVWGEHDRIIPVHHAYEAQRAIPDSRLEVIEGAGHFPHAEQPARFVAILKEFLSTTEPATLGHEQLRQLLREPAKAARPSRPGSA